MEEFFGPLKVSRGMRGKLCDALLAMEVDVGGMDATDGYLADLAPLTRQRLQRCWLLARGEKEKGRQRGMEFCKVWDGHCYGSARSHTTLTFVEPVQ